MVIFFEFQLPLDTRIGVDIMKLAARNRNFETIYIDDRVVHEWETENGKFEGTLGNLQNGLYDFALSAYTMSPIRLRYTFKLNYFISASGCNVTCYKFSVQISTANHTVFPYFTSCVVTLQQRPAAP